jgi:cytochrome c biogenesis protein CcdA
MGPPARLVTESVTLFAAFGGGLISFLSPCVLPIVPAYLSIITGLEVGEIREGKSHLRRITRDTGLFIAGFSGGTPVAGVAFGFGWTPCIGPVLTSILAIAAAEGNAGRGRCSSSCTPPVSACRSWPPVSPSVA